MGTEPLPSKLAVEPTAKAALRIADALVAKLPELKPEPFWAITHSLLVASMQTVDAIYYLVAESQPKAFPAQTAPLIRTLLEGFGNFLALAESPEERPGLFARDAYLTASEWHRQCRKRHGADPKWAERLRLYAEGLQTEARTIGLSATEGEEPAKYLKRWPTPGGLLGYRYGGPVRLTDEREAVFAEIYDAWYPHLSYYAHQRLGALEKSVNSLSPSPKERKVLAGDVLTSASFFLACLLTEIENAAGLAPTPRLREAWAYIHGRSHEMSLVYETRYRRLLEQGDTRGR